MKTALTPTHPRWESFINDLSWITFTRGCECDLQIARELMGAMEDVDIPASIVFFEDNGGFCDCEILMNIECPRRDACGNLKQ